MVAGDQSDPVDCLVLGAGPGGYVVALRAAQRGRSVTIVERDVAKANALEDMDDVMDDLQKELLREVFEAGNSDDSVQLSVQVALVGRYFERVADHAVNVGERVNFMVNGFEPIP